MKLYITHTLWVFINSKSARQRTLWEISVFSLTFPIECKFTFPILWKLYGFLLLPKYLRNPLLWNICFFPYFSRNMGIHFSHVLGIVWISASSKIFNKPINLKCLCFPILFLYYMEIQFSHVFGAAWISASNNNFEMFMVPSQPEQKRFKNIASTLVFTLRELFWNVIFGKFI